MSGEDPDSGRGGDAERLTLVPSLVPGVDLARFRFDSETESLLAMMDGRRSIADIADLTGVDADTAAERVERLTLSGIVRPTAIPAPPPAPATGGSGTGSPLDLLERADREGFTGAMRFRRDGMQVAVHFEKGAPLAVSSDDPRHEPGVMLAEAGRINAATAAAYRAAAAKGAESPALALFKAGVTDRRDLGRLLTWHGSAVLREISAWTGCECATSSGEPFPARLGRCPLVVPRRSTPPSVAPGPQIGWRDRELDDAEALILEQSLPRYLVATPRAAQVVSRFGLAEREQRLVEHLIGTPTQVSRALAISTAFRSVTRRLLVRLIAAGAFELHETSPDGVAPHDPDDLEPCARRMSHDNHFDRLTAHAISSPAEIRERYEKRLCEFDPARYPGVTPEQRRALGEIRGHLDSAFAVLSDAEQRRDYRRQVYGRDQIRNFLDLQLRKAEVALRMRDDPAGALAIAESVLDIEPAEVTGRLLKAGSLARLGRVAEARAMLSRIGNLPPQLAQYLREIRAMAGLA